MAKGPWMNPERYKKIKEMLQTNRDKGVGWSLAYIGQLCGCSGVTVGRVDRSKDYGDYWVLLRAEHKKPEAKGNKNPDDKSIKKTEEHQGIGVARAFADLCQSLDRLTNELKRLDHPTWLQTTLFGDLPKGE